MCEDGEEEPVIESQKNSIEYIRWSQQFSAKSAVFPIESVRSNKFARTQSGKNVGRKVAKTPDAKWQERSPERSLAGRNEAIGWVVAEMDTSGAPGQYHPVQIHGTRSRNSPSIPRKRPDVVIFDVRKICRITNLYDNGLPYVLNFHVWSEMRSVFPSSFQEIPLRLDRVGFSQQRRESRDIHLVIGKDLALLPHPAHN